jgi:hypothetical protein
MHPLLQLMYPLQRLCHQTLLSMLQPRHRLFGQPDRTSMSFCSLPKTRLVSQVHYLSRTLFNDKAMARIFYLNSLMTLLHPLTLASLGAMRSDSSVAVLHSGRSINATDCPCRALALVRTLSHWRAPHQAPIMLIQAKRFTTRYRTQMAAQQSTGAPQCSMVVLVSLILGPSGIAKNIVVGSLSCQVSLLQHSVMKVARILLPGMCPFFTKGSI